MIYFLSRPRCCLRYCQIWCWYFFYGSFSSSPRNEIYHSSSYGWCHWYLRSYHCCNYWNSRYSISKIQTSNQISVSPTGYTDFKGFADLGSGLSVGLAGLAAGMAIGIVGDAGVRASAQQPRLFVGMILILIFAEALALYGLIVALILSTK